MHKDDVRKLILSLKPMEAMQSLIMLGVLEDKDPKLGLSLKDPAIYMEEVDPIILTEIREKGVVPSIPVVVVALLGQRFNILPNPAATIIAAGASMGVTPHYRIEKRIYCDPNGHSIQGGKERWELYRRGVYHMSFTSDAVAHAMVQLGVKID